MRLDKYLTKTNIGNRKFVKKLIKEKKIIVDNEIITNESFNLDVDANVYMLENKKLIKLIYEKNIYLMLNKPKDYVCATIDNQHKVVLELIKEFKDRNLHIVGRLDIDTEGLLLITDDGDFTHKITSPKSNIPKKYYVEFCGKMIDNAESIVHNGITFDDNTKTKPGILELVSNVSAYITIYDGMYHQVKRMFHYLGTEVTYLKRIKIGNLSLDENLKLGEYKKLTQEEKNLSLN